MTRPGESVCLVACFVSKYHFSSLPSSPSLASCHLSSNRAPFGTRLDLLGVLHVISTLFLLLRVLCVPPPCCCPQTRGIYLIYPLKKALPQPNSHILAEFTGGLVGLTMELHVRFVQMMHKNKKNQQQLGNSDFRTFSAWNILLLLLLSQICTSYS